MMNPRSRIMADVSMNWPQMLTRLNVIGVRRLGEWITMASDLFSFMMNPLSQNHVFTSCMQASNMYAGITVPLVLQYLREFDAPALQS